MRLEIFVSYGSMEGYDLSSPLAHFGSRTFTFFDSIGLDDDR